MKRFDLSQFKTYLTDTKKISASSAECYLRDILSFESFLSENNQSLLAATKTNVLAFMVDMQKSGKADASVNRTISSLRTLYGYLLHNSSVKADPTWGIKLPRIEKKAHDILSLREIDALLDISDDESPLAIRDRAMLEVMYAGGLSVTELISLRECDIDTDLGYIRCTQSRSIRIVPLGKKAIEAVKKYVENLRPRIAEDNVKTLFVNYIGQPMSRQGFWKLIKEYAKKKGIEKDITPRTLRASFAIHLIENGADIYAVQEMMGHKDISSTQSYARLAGGKIREVYNKTHPRA